MAQSAFDVCSVSARDPRAAALLEALTAELALAGYSEDESFGYTVEQLELSSVHLLGAWTGGELAGIGGLELQGDHTAELKRFFVMPNYRGSGAAGAVLTALVAYARERRVTRLRLETGDKQLAAITFYQRNGFQQAPCFGPYVHSATSVCMQRDIG